MSLRRAFGGDAGRLHELLDELLDREDVLFCCSMDIGRLTTSVACHHASTNSWHSRSSAWCEPLAQREWPWKEEGGTNVKRSACGSGARVREHVGRDGSGLTACG